MSTSCSICNDAKIPESAVCAVVVTFNAVAEHVEISVRRLSSRGVHVVIVDNGSAAPAAIAIQKVGEATKAEVIALPENLGIAAAQNIGVLHAAELGVRFVLLLDHDSLPASDMVRTLLDAYQRLMHESVKVGAVGPVSVDSRTGSRAGFVRLHGFFIARRHCANDGGIVESDFLIASGSLIPIEVLAEIGAMNEGYFIDHVDTEWCLRARDRGYGIYGVCAATLFHRLGENVMRVWLGRTREVPVHSPLRNYYIFRNTVLMIKAAPMPMMWRLAHVFRLVQFMTFFVLAVRPRRLRLKFMVKGLVDGLLGRVGPLKRQRAIEIS